MSKRCEQAVGELGSEEAATYVAIQKECEKSLSRTANVEDVLSRVRTKLTAMVAGDTLAGATRAQLGKIEEAIRTTIAVAARPAVARIPNELPHHGLARWIRRLDRPTPIELFTTNYDTLLERALEDEWVAVFDGFVGSRRPVFLTSLDGSSTVDAWRCLDQAVEASRLCQLELEGSLRKCFAADRPRE
ncbi:MAG: hypothetical protein WA484_09595 [Solirubrobacteraceae bacterium]